MNKEGLSRKILSDVIVYMKYSRWVSEKGRRENWDEIIDRNKAMHVKKFPLLEKELDEAYKYVYEKRILPSMRSLQFAGKAIEKNPSRINNCGALPISTVDSFKEFAFLLMCGCGIGFSVQKHHIRQLPEIMKPKKERRYLIGDSIELWSDSVGALISSYLSPRVSKPKFDYTDIRPKGTPLVTSGGLAPGPQPLHDCHHNIQKLLDSKNDGEKLTPIEVYDINCFIADMVVVGGTRRSSCIVLFSFDDEEMLSAKFGDWYVDNPQRGRANNSAVILRHKITEEEFGEFFKKIKNSNSGEPGIFFSNNSEVLLNPCLPSWAKILTPNGLISIEDIKKGDFVWSKEGFSEVLNKFDNGMQEVFEYETTAGVFCGTSTHEVVSNGKKVPVGKAKSIDILLAPHLLDVGLGYIPPLPHDSQYIMDGLVLGDGSKHKASNDLRILYIGDDDQDYFNSEIKNLITKHRPGISSDGKAYEIKTEIKKEELTKTYNRKIPQRYITASELRVCSFLRGLYSANGCVSNNLISLKASSKQLIHQVQLMLSSIGIRSYYVTNKPTEVKWDNGTYITKENYNLQISKGRDIFYHKIGFIQKYKNEKLKPIIEIEGPKYKETFEIKNVASKGIIQVYDIEVDNDSHTYWSQGFNVSNCAEISLSVDAQTGAGGFCNLVEVDVSNIATQKEFNQRVMYAARIATFQASYTDYHYLNEQWKVNAEKEALIGVGLTGIASGCIDNLDVKEAAKVAVEENKRVAKLLGINPSFRVTTVKPSGTASLVLSSSSGIHPWYSEFYIRRVRIGKDESIYKYLNENHQELIEDDYFNPTNQSVISIPVKAPEGAVTRAETALQFLERIKRVYKDWVKPGHVKGDNTNNISATVSVKENEWDRVQNWLWINQKFYTGISLLPYDGFNYKQAPFEEISQEKYNELIVYLKKIDLTKISEKEDNTKLQGEIACSGGACEIV